MANLRHAIGIDAGQVAAIGDTEQQSAAMPVQKSANSFIDVPVEALCTGFELDG